MRNSNDGGDCGCPSDACALHDARRHLWRLTADIGEVIEAI